MSSTDRHNAAARGEGRSRKEYLCEYARANRERINANQRRSWKRNQADRAAAQRAYRNRPEVRERLQAQARECYAANREAERARMLARYYARKAKQKKADPVASAKRLLAKAALAAKQGYSGKLVPGGF
jgi:hypothetical protein